jgi:hypothetical protein
MFAQVVCSVTTKEEELVFGAAPAGTLAETETISLR